MKTIKTTTDLTPILMQKKIPFTIDIGNNTSIITVPSQDKKYIVSQSHISYSTLGFISSVKRSNELYQPIEKVDQSKINELKKNINYFKFGSCQEGVYKNIIELDVNKAYWNLAYKLGMISQDIFIKGLERPKMDRLIGFGARAAKKTRYQYYPHSDSFVYVDTLQDLIGRYSFFKVAFELDKVMMKVYSKVPVLFYWVDAFFLDEKYKIEVEKIVKENNLSLKIKEVDEVEIYTDEHKVKNIFISMKGGEKKNFKVPNKNISANTVLNHNNIVNKFKKSKGMIKLRKRNVYKNERDKRGRLMSNINDLKDKKGVYFIHDEKGKLIYIGHSISDLKSTIMRHFQVWSLSRFEVLQGVQRDRITYTNDFQKLNYSVKIYLTKGIDAYALEQTLIEKYRPRDNKEKIAAISDRRKRNMLDRFEKAKASGKIEGKIGKMKYNEGNELEYAFIDDSEIPF